MFKLKILALMVLANLVLADGPFMMKGLSPNYTFEHNCKTLQALLRDEEIVNEDIACGVKKKNTNSGTLNVSETYIMKNSDGNVYRIVIGPTQVDKIFGTKNMTYDQFAQAFIDNYDWIDELNGEMVDDRVTHSFVSHKFGWELSMSTSLKEAKTYKKISVRFFEPVQASFTEGPGVNFSEPLATANNENTFESGADTKTECNKLLENYNVFVEQENKSSNINDSCKYSIQKIHTADKLKSFCWDTIDDKVKKQNIYKDLIRTANWARNMCTYEPSSTIQNYLVNDTQEEYEESDEPPANYMN